MAGSIAYTYSALTLAIFLLSRTDINTSDRKYYQRINYMSTDICPSSTLVG